MAQIIATEKALNITHSLLSMNLRINRDYVYRGSRADPNDA